MTEQAENITTERPAPFTLGSGGGRPFALPARGRGTIKLGAPDTGGTLLAFELVIEPGEGPGLHVHRREHELWYVLEANLVPPGRRLGPRAHGRPGLRPLRHTPHLPKYRPGDRAVAGHNRTVRVGGVLPRVRPAGDRSLRLAEALDAAAQFGGLEFLGPPLKVSAPHAEATA